MRHSKVTEKGDSSQQKPTTATTSELSDQFSHQASKATLAQAKLDTAQRKAHSSLTREAALNDAGLTPSPALAAKNRELIRQSRWPFESFVVVDGQVRWR